MIEGRAGSCDVRGQMVWVPFRCNGDVGGGKHRVVVGRTGRGHGPIVGSGRVARTGIERAGQDEQCRAGSALGGVGCCRVPSKCDEAWVGGSVGSLLVEQACEVGSGGNVDWTPAGM